jgi:hypothetical protein
VTSAEALWAKASATPERIRGVLVELSWNFICVGPLNGLQLKQALLLLERSSAGIPTVARFSHGLSRVNNKYDFASMLNSLGFFYLGENP